MTLESLFGVAGKRALVTGGGSGLGRICAEALVRAGADVTIASRKLADCERTAADLSAYGTCTALAVDLSTEAGVHGLAEAMAARADRLDILVNNSGATWGAPYETFPWNAWSRVMTVNVAALFTLTRDLTPLLAAAGTAEAPARVVNMGSVMGTTPIGDNAYSYSASKAAVHHLTRVLARELAPRRITVNAIAPGPFRSRMTAFALSDSAGEQRTADVVPLGRIGSEDDLAGTLLYLCGRAGAYTTGAILPLDGGMSADAIDHLFPDG